MSTHHANIRCEEGESQKGMASEGDSGTKDNPEDILARAVNQEAKQGRCSSWDDVNQAETH